MFSALTDATGQIDPKFLVAYWLPALVATVGGLVLAALLVGLAPFDFWVNNLDSVEQILVGVALLGFTTVLALFFQAVKRPVLLLFTGNALPRPLAAWGVRRQRQARAQTGPWILACDEQDPDFGVHYARHLFERGFPHAETYVKPTRFGNVMANLEEHTRFVHGMDHWLWWPRLLPLLPEAMVEITSSEIASTQGLLNLSLVWAALGLGGAAVLGVAGALWMTALKVLVIGLGLSWLCYRAAVAQGTEAGRHVRAAFDLYRHEILKQMELDVPSDREAEPVLWGELTRRLMDRSHKDHRANVVGSSSVDLTPNGPAPHRKPVRRRRQPTS